MLDKPEKTRELMDILDAAVPFEVALMPDLIEHLARQQKPIAINPIETVSGVSYLGDVGGIACHIQPEDAESAVVVSLTHVRVRRTLPFAAAVLDYQKHRVKKLRRQQSRGGRPDLARRHRFYRDSGLVQKLFYELSRRAGLTRGVPDELGDPPPSMDRRGVRVAHNRWAEIL